MISIPDSGTYAGLVRTGVSTLVRARERDSCRGLGTRASHNIELRALHVELSSGVSRRAVQGCNAALLGPQTMEVGRGMRKKRTDDLMAEEVLPALDAARNRERHFALVRNQSVYGPLSSRHRQTILVDLEPLQIGNGALSRIWNLRPTPYPVSTLEIFAQGETRKKRTGMRSRDPCARGRWGPQGRRQSGSGRGATSPTR